MENKQYRSSKYRDSETNWGSLQPPPIIKEPLMSAIVINRTLFLNHNPALNYLLPLSNCWRLDDLTREIQIAAAKYDLEIEWHNARYLAFKLTKAIVKDSRRFNGGVGLG